MVPFCPENQTSGRSIGVSEVSKYRPIGLIEVVSRGYYLCCERTIAVLTG